MIVFMVKWSLLCRIREKKGREEEAHRESVRNTPKRIEDAGDDDVKGANLLV